MEVLLLIIKPLSEFFIEQGLFSSDSDVLKKINYIRRVIGLDFCMEDGPWIAGGSVIRLVEGLELGWHDIDIFFPNPEKFECFREKLDTVVESEEKKKFNKDKRIYRSPYGGSSSADRVFRTATAYTYTLEALNNTQVQIIRRSYYPSVYSVLGEFDFRVCMFATDGNMIAYLPEALEDLKNKRLKIHQINKESVLIKRFYKYLSYGFTPYPGDTKLIHEVVKDSPKKYALPSAYPTPSRGFY